MQAQLSGLNLDSNTQPKNLLLYTSSNDDDRRKSKSYNTCDLIINDDPIFGNYVNKHNALSTTILSSKPHYAQFKNTARNTNRDGLAYADTATTYTNQFTASNQPDQCVVPAGQLVQSSHTASINWP